MKTIRIISDLHLEAYYGKPEHLLAEQFIPHDDRDAESILVLAGDISSKKDQLYNFIQVVEPRFAKVIFIPGNHEFYRHHYQDWNAEMEAKFKGLTNTLWAFDTVNATVIDNVRFIYGTMWADGGALPSEQILVQHSLNDFKIIGYNDGVFHVKDMMEIYNAQKHKITAYLSVPFDGKTVVITHHLPSYDLCHPRFGEEINGGFAANCDDIIDEYMPQVWIHGHTHDSIDRMIGMTRIVANPLGYPSEFNANSEYNTFKTGPKFIEIGE